MTMDGTTMTNTISPEELQAITQANIQAQEGMQALLIPVLDRFPKFVGETTCSAFMQYLKKIDPYLTQEEKQGVMTLSGKERIFHRKGTKLISVGEIIGAFIFNAESLPEEEKAMCRFVPKSYLWAILKILRQQKSSRFDVCCLAFLCYQNMSTIFRDEDFNGDELPIRANKVTNNLSKYSKFDPFYNPEHKPREALA